MDEYNKVAEALKELNIEYELVEHPPAFTCEEADSYIEGYEGVRTKTMFLTNKKKTDYFLVIMDDVKRLDMVRFEEVAETKRVKMASPESLFEKMQLTPGIVTPFGLLNNESKDIKVFIDKDIFGEERMSFHPNTNDKTIFVKTTDLVKFLESVDCAPVVAEL